MDGNAWDWIFHAQIMKETVAVWPFTVTAVITGPPREFAGEVQYVGATPGKTK